MKLTDLPEKYRMEAYEQMHGKTSHNTPHPAPYLEQNSLNEQVAKEDTPRFDSPCRIHVHSIRKRLADADGISAKAAIDGLVHAGIFPDDKDQYVKEVSYSQEKCATGQAERTIITIEVCSQPGSGVG